MCIRAIRWCGQAAVQEITSSLTRSTHVILAGHCKCGSAGEASGGGAAGRHWTHHHGGHSGAYGGAAGGGRRREGGGWGCRAALAAAGLGLAPQAAGLDVEASLALSVGLTLPVDHLLYLLVVLLNVTEVVLVVGTVIVVAVGQGAPVARQPAEELHLSGQGLQLTAELPVLLLQLGHDSTEGPTQARRLLQTPLHPQLESADVHVDLPDGVPEGVLVACQSCTHRLPLWGGRPGVAQVSHLSQGFHHSWAGGQTSGRLRVRSSGHWRTFSQCAEVFDRLIGNGRRMFTGRWVGRRGQRSGLFYRHSFSSFFSWMSTAPQAQMSHSV